MPRTIGSGNSITVGTGQIPPSDVCTWLAIVRVGALTSGQTVFGLSSSAGISGIDITTGGVIRTFRDNSFATWSSGFNVAANDGWIFIGSSKRVSGDGSFQRCKVKYDTGAVTASGSSSGTGSATAITSARLGSLAAGTSPWLGDIAAIGCFAGAVFSAADLSRFAYSLESWRSLGPGAMWVLDQASTSMPVLDWTGGGANQTAITGTSVATASPPIGYGHPVTLATTRSTASHLFTTQTPSTTNASDGTPGITTATTVKFGAAGTVSGVRFYSTTTVSGVYTVALYTVDSSDPGTGTLLASKTMTSAPAAGTWNSVNFDSPVSVNTSTLYRAAVFSGAGRYVATTNFTEFVSGAGGLTNGDIWAPHNGDNPVGAISISQGTFEINAALTYPNDPGNQTNYYVDVDFQPSGGGPVTHNADATLAATGSLSGAATWDTSTTATLAGTGTLAGTAARSTSTTVVLAGVGALTATGVRTQDTTATLTGTGGLTGTAAKTTFGTVTLAGTGGLSGTATAALAGAATLAATGSLTASGDVTSAASTAVLSGFGGLTVTAARNAAGMGNLAGIGALTASGSRSTDATATFAALGSFAAAGTVDRISAATLAGIATLAGTAEVVRQQSGTLVAVGALSGAGQTVAAGSAVLAAIGALAGASGTSQSASVTFAGIGTLTAATTYRRRPGRFTVGSRRSTITAGSVRADAYVTGGVDG